MCSYAFFLVAFLVGYVQAWGQDVEVGNTTAECADQMIKWCNGMKFPQEGAGMTMVANSFSTPEGSYRALCISDSDGTNCTKNGQQWFSCTPENKFYYKGQLLTSESKDGADDDMCKTADQAFNDLFIQNLDVRNITTDVRTELQKGFRGFLEQMMRMQEQLDQLNNMFNNDNWFRGRRNYRTTYPYGIEKEV